MATHNVPLVAKGTGTILICFHYKGVNTNFLLKNVLHVPNAAENLISAGALQDVHVTQVIDKKLSLYSQFANRIFAQGLWCGDNLFALDLSVIKTPGPISLVVMTPLLLFIEAHKCLAYIGMDKLEKMLLANQTGGLNIPQCGNTVCDECIEANFKHFPFFPCESW